MGGVTIERWLVGKGAGVLPAGIQVFSCPGGNCKKGISFPTEAVDGMFVFYSADDADRLSVDPSATPNVNNLIFGKYYARNGNGVITEILKMAGEKITCDHIVSGTSAVPITGRGEVGRATASCVKKNTIYSVKAYIESNRTRQEWAENKKMERVGSYDTSKNPACDDCDDDTLCTTVRNGIIDDLNGATNTGDFPTFTREPIPVKFFAWHQYSHEFCLAGVSNACGDCDSFTGVKGIDIQGVQTLFGTTLNSATTSHITQLNELIYKIDCAFGAHEGKAWLGQGSLNGSCVDQKLVINSTVGVKLIKHDDTLIEACNVIDNGAQACAIGWYGELAEESCDCQGKSDESVTYYPTHVTLVSNGGFVDFASSVVTTAVIPLNWGVQLWDHQFASDVKPGFNQSIQRSGGLYDRDLAFSRPKNVDLKCDIGYCVISIVTNQYGHEPYALGISGKAYVRTIVAIPWADADDAVLIADLNAIKNVNNCNGVIDFACTEDPEPGPPSPSVSPSRYATPSVTRSITPSITATRSITVSRSISVSITVTRSLTPSISVSV